MLEETILSLLDSLFLLDTRFVFILVGYLTLFFKKLSNRNSSVSRLIVKQKILPAYTIFIYSGLEIVLHPFSVNCRLTFVIYRIIVMASTRSRFRKRTKRQKNKKSKYISSSRRQQELANSLREKLFKVEKISGKRIVVQYRVNWEGYPDDAATWENEENLTSTCRDLIEIFENICNSSSQSENVNSFEISEINKANSEHETMNPVLSFAEEVVVDLPSTSDTCNCTNKEKSPELELANFNSSSMIVEVDTLECTNDEDSTNRKNYDELEDDTNNVISEFLENVQNGDQSKSGYTWHKIKTVANLMGLARVLESGALKIEEINLSDRSKIPINLMDEACELKILGGTDKEGLKILLELKNERTGERISESIPTARVRANIPQLLIAYYEKHLKFVVTTN